MRGCTQSGLARHDAGLEALLDPWYVPTKHAFWHHPQSLSAVQSEHVPQSEHVASALCGLQSANATASTAVNAISKRISMNYGGWP